MPDIEEIKKKIQEQKTAGEEKPQKELLEVATIDMEKIDKIVERMKKKYMDEGVEFEEVGGRLAELRGIIAEGEAGEVEIQKVEELREAKTPIVKFLGNLYLYFRGILEPISRPLSGVKQMERLSYYLYSANIKLSAKQYLAISLGAAILALIVAIPLTAALFVLVKASLTVKTVLGIILPFGLALMVFGAAMLVPQRLAKRRGEETSVELPFALRHMATELKAGIGLYKTIQAIAVAGYGSLSEEFARTVTEIEEGTDAKDALRHLALRTQSKALRISLMHIVRAMETGGNLSTIMNEIAEDVSFELRLKVRDFSQKMNFFGVVFIFTAIVFPVMITILGIIRNSPLSAGALGFRQLPLSVGVITMIFVVLIPLMLIMLIGYIKAIQPRV